MNDRTVMWLMLVLAALSAPGLVVVEFTAVRSALVLSFWLLRSIIVNWRS
jgi:hypothetical protein